MLKKYIQRRVFAKQNAGLSRIRHFTRRHLD